MSTKLLDLPDCHYVVAFRAIERILRTDPVLARTVRTWRTLSGDPGDKTMPAEGDCPILALSPLPVPDTVDTVSTSQVNVQIGVELYAAGTCVDDIVNLWYGAVVPALYLDKPYQDATILAYLRCSMAEESVLGFEVTRPAFMRFLPSDGKDVDPLAGLQYGLGAIKFNYRRKR